MNLNRLINARSASLLGLGLSAVLLTSLAGTANAQLDGSPPGQPALRGPDVRDDSVPGQKRRFGPGKAQGKDRLDDRGTPPRIFMQALRILKDNDTPGDARLTPAQDEKLQAIGRGFREEVKAYMDQHHQEIQGLREKIGPEANAKIDGKLRNAGFPGASGKNGPQGRPEGRPEGKGGKRSPRDGGPNGGLNGTSNGGRDGGLDGEHMQPPLNDQAGDGQKLSRGKPRKEGKLIADDLAAAQRLKEIMDAAPKFKDSEAQAWALLTETQRPIVQDELARLRENGPSRLNPGQGRPSKGGPDGALDAKEGREKMRERLENLSLEEREQMKQKIQDRRAKRGPANGQPKPPPPMEDVDVPTPEPK